MVVVVVGLPVVVEPRLHAFGPILAAVRRGVFSFPKPFGYRCLVSGSQTFVERFVDF